jgi:Tfp pilus assembly protein PilF
MSTLETEPLLTRDVTATALEAALAAYRQALALRPTSAENHNNIGAVLQMALDAFHPSGKQRRGGDE